MLERGHDSSFVKDLEIHWCSGKGTARSYFCGNTSQSRNEQFIPLSAECADLNCDSLGSMKCPNALAACVWPSLEWEWQTLPFTSGLLHLSAVNCLSSCELSYVVFSIHAFSRGQKKKKVCMIEEYWCQNWEWILLKRVSLGSLLASVSVGDGGL